MEHEVEQLSEQEQAELDEFARGWDAAVEVAHWRVTARNTLPIVIPSVIVIIIALLVR